MITKRREPSTNFCCATFAKIPDISQWKRTVKKEGKSSILITCKCGTLSPHHNALSPESRERRYRSDACTWEKLRKAKTEDFHWRIKGAVGRSNLFSDLQAQKKL